MYDREGIEKQKTQKQTEGKEKELKSGYSFLENPVHELAELGSRRIPVEVDLGSGNL